MHFWIDKRSQGCGFRGRPLVPPSISGYGRNQRNLCIDFHPKPMVTPIHRFQSIESVANYGLRHHARSTPESHSRVPSNNFQNCPVDHTPSTSNVHSDQQNVGRSIEMIGTTTLRRDNRPAHRLKCGFCALFTGVSLLLAGTELYFYGVNNGFEALVFLSIFAVILIIGGIVSVCESTTGYMASASLPHRIERLPSPVLEQEQTDDYDDDSRSTYGHHEPMQNQHSHISQSQVPTSHHRQLPPHAAELPPPPYHIAIMLPSQDDIATTESAQVIRDFPPPSYEKAVT